MRRPLIIVTALVLFCIALPPSRAAAQRPSGQAAAMPSLLREEKAEAKAVDPGQVPTAARTAAATAVRESRLGPDPAVRNAEKAQPGQFAPRLGAAQTARAADTGAAAVAAAADVASSATVDAAVQVDGLTEPEAGGFPPDPGVAVGPNHVVLVSNFSWKAVDRTGNTARGATRFVDWFRNQGITANYFFNPKIVYRDGHFYIVVDWFDTINIQSRILISVSQTSDPNGGWCNFAINGMVGGTGRGDNGAYADYPNVGITGNGLYIATDHYLPGTATKGLYQLSMLSVFRRSDLESCNGTVARQYTSFFNEDGFRSYVMQPVVDYDAGGNDAFYMVNSFVPFEHVDSRTTVWRLNDPFGANPTWSRWTLATGRVSNPPDAAQPGTTSKLPTFDATILSAVRRGGVLWTVQSTGVWNSAASCTIASIYWMSINAPASTNPGVGPSLQQDGYYGSGDCNDYYYLPALAIDGNGDMGMVFNRSGTGVYAEIRYTGRSASDAPGTLAPSKLLVASPSVIEDRWRWGSYSSAAADPADPGQVWVAAEYLKAHNSWGMRVGQLQLSGSGGGGSQAPVITSQPSNTTVAAGQPASFSVTATGTAPLSYQWQRNGANISGATSATYTLPSATPADNGAQFRVIVTNSAGSATSNTATLTVTSAPPAGGTTVYDDALASGWMNWSWGSSVNLANTRPVYSGSNSIAFTVTSAWGALYLRSGTPVTLTSTARLHFAMQASRTGQRFNVALVNANGAAIGWQSLAANGGDPTAGAWTVYDIPASAFGVGGRQSQVSGIWIQDATGAPQAIAYVDAVSFSDR